LGILDPREIFTPIAATSIGIFEENILVDLCYEEDSVADADFNIVMASDGKIVEIQGAAEGSRYSVESVHGVLDAARKTLPTLFDEQKKAISNIDPLKK
jgi:ribonuclease PH